MQKRWIAVIVCVVVGLMLVGCNSHVSFGYSASTMKSEQNIRMTRSFRYSDGIEENSFEVNTEGDYRFTIAAKMDEGEVRITLSKAGNVVLEYAGSELQDEQTIHLEPGEYLVTFEKMQAKNASLKVELNRKQN